MKIDEAIEILEEQRDLEVFNDFKRIRDGFQLGIEALKRIQSDRHAQKNIVTVLLLGETKCQ